MNLPKIIKNIILNYLGIKHTNENINKEIDIKNSYEIIYIKLQKIEKTIKNILYISIIMLILVVVLLIYILLT